MTLKIIAEITMQLITERIIVEAGRLLWRNLR